MVKIPTNNATATSASTARAPWRVRARPFLSSNADPPQKYVAPYRVQAPSIAQLAAGCAVLYSMQRSPGCAGDPMIGRDDSPLRQLGRTVLPAVTRGDGQIIAEVDALRAAEPLRAGDLSILIGRAAQLKQL